MTPSPPAKLRHGPGLVLGIIGIAAGGALLYRQAESRKVELAGTASMVAEPEKMGVQKLPRQEKPKTDVDSLPVWTQDPAAGPYLESLGKRGYPADPEQAAAALEADLARIYEFKNINKYKAIHSVRHTYLMSRLAADPSPSALDASYQALLAALGKKISPFEMKFYEWETLCDLVTSISSLPAERRQAVMEGFSVFHAQDSSPFAATILGVTEGMKLATSDGDLPEGLDHIADPELKKAAELYLLRDPSFSADAGKMQPLISYYLGSHSLVTLDFGDTDDLIAQSYRPHPEEIGACVKAAPPGAKRDLAIQIIIGQVIGIEPDEVTESWIEKISDPETKEKMRKPPGQ